MIFPSIDQLTKGGKYNRYELVIATAKAARKITDIHTARREEMEKNSNSKDFSQDSKAALKFDIPIVEEKAVKTAIQKIYEGEFVIKR